MAVDREKVVNAMESAYDAGLSVIPCKPVWDKKKNVFSGKIPLVGKWSQYCEEAVDDDQFNTWMKIPSISGFAYVTGTASNIACIDIDTEDPEMIERILAVLDHTPCKIIGNPKRGGKLLYRLYDSIETYTPPIKLKDKVKDGMGNTVVDIFMGNAYIVAPPSLHSCGPNKENTITYEWDTVSVEEFGVEHLPLIDRHAVEKISLVVRGHTKTQVAQCLPKGAVSEGKPVKGRWEAITALTGVMVKKEFAFTDIVNALLDHDLENYPDDSFFLDKTKIGKATKSRELNALFFVTDFLMNINNGRNEVEIELPQLPVDQAPIRAEEKGFAPFKYIENEYKIPKFDTSLIPNDAVRKLITEASEANSVPEQSVFFYFLSVYSSLLGNKVVIQPYHLNREFLQTSNLYVGLVAKSGDRKSEITSIAKKPLMTVERELKSAMKDHMAKAVVVNDDIDIVIKEKLKQRKEEIVNNGIGSAFSEQLMDEIHQLEQKKVEHRTVSLYEQTNTPEKFFEIVEENNEGIFIEFNEWASAHARLYGRDGESLRQFIMDGWDGNKPFSYKTKHNGENIIDELNLSVGFSCQEDVMDQIIADLGKIKKENDGLMQRFILMAPSSRDKKVKDISFVVNEDINNIFRNTKGIRKEDSRMLLDRGAYNLWAEYQGKIGAKVAKERSKPMISFMNKYVGLIIRVACLVEHLSNGGKKPEIITEKSMETAEKLMDYAEHNLRFLFLNQQYKNARKIVSQIQMSIIEDGTLVSSLTRKHSDVFTKDTDEARIRLEIMVRHGYMKMEHTGKAWVIRIHPRAYES
jgi:hypothetical protein